MNGQSAIILSEEKSSITPEDLYNKSGYNYPKFFKMDKLSKWAWLGAEGLLSSGDSQIYNQYDKEKIAVVLSTADGCISVDKKYKDSIATVPSPALFVYTLPNIMLGEICIRHGFKGEQACTVNEQLDAEQITFIVNDLLTNRGMDACICGWVNATDDKHDVCLFWVTKSAAGIGFTADTVNAIYKSQQN